MNLLYTNCDNLGEVLKGISQTYPCPFFYFHLGRTQADLNKLQPVISPHLYPLCQKVYSTDI